MHYRPHSFDTHSFFFGVKCLAVLAVLLVGVRYSSVFASDILAGDDIVARVAGAASPIVATVDPSSSLVASSTATQKPAHVPGISAQAYLLANLDTGAVYAAKNSETPYPIASISKLLVALAALETLPPEGEITITRADRALTEGTPGSIQRDETFRVADLLYPLLMESNNSVAYALQRAGGGAEFVRVMLRLAHEIGMDETLLDDSSGLSPRNNASAGDLLALAHYIDKRTPAIFEITRTKKKSVTAESGRSYPVPNLNIFTNDPAFIGGKTGYTDEAKQTMLALFEIPSKDTRENERIVIVILQSDSRKGDVEKLKSWFEKTAMRE
jgi:D-alanyl-D-alanine carboxypeptidase (penicillin-binding protein 5/6)